MHWMEIHLILQKVTKTIPVPLGVFIRTQRTSTSRRLIIIFKVNNKNYVLVNCIIAVARQVIELQTMRSTFTESNNQHRNCWKTQSTLCRHLNSKYFTALYFVTSSVMNMSFQARTSKIITQIIQVPPVLKYNRIYVNIKQKNI